MGLKQSLVQILLNAVLIGFYVSYLLPMVASRLNAFTNILMLLGFFLFTFGLSNVLAVGGKKRGYPLAIIGAVIIVVVWIFIVPR